MAHFIRGLSGNWLVFFITLANETSMLWFGYDQYSLALISKDFKYWFPETKKANISGITSSCFADGLHLLKVYCACSGLAFLSNAAGLQSWNFRRAS